MTCPAVRSACLAIALAVTVSGCETPTIYQPGAQGAPQEEVAQRPRFTPGDEFWYHTGGAEILVEEYLGMVDGLHAFRHALRNETLYYSPDLALVKVDRAFGEDEYFEPDDGTLVFPLALGTTWTRSYRVRSESRRYIDRRTRRCEVVERGRVQSQAGAFSVFRIACVTNALDQAPRAPVDVFYAPAVGRIVLVRSLGSGADLSLIEYKRAE